MATMFFDPQFEGITSSNLQPVADKAVCITEKDHSSVVYKISSLHLNVLDAKIESIMRNYHPAGYMTRVIQRAHCPRTNFFWAIVRRSDSCD